MTYGELLADSEGRASQIRQIPDLAHGSVILLHFIKYIESLKWLWPVLYVGYLPALFTPFLPDASWCKEHLEYLKGLFMDPDMLTSQRLALQFPEVKILSIHLVEALTMFRPSSEMLLPPPVQDGPGHLAILTLTSGSMRNA